MATKPRQILPGRTWFLTGRAVARQHRFVPTKRVAQTIWYCLAVVSQKYDVRLHGFVWMSNHYHLVLTDVVGELPDFMRDLNSLVSKALNAMRGIRGENYERRGYNAVVVGDGQRLLRHCAYVEANPCSANLVKLATHWFGVSSAGMEYGSMKTVKRPDYGLWSEGKGGRTRKMSADRAVHCGRIKCPPIASVRLERPPCLDGGSTAETRFQVRAIVRELEKKAHQDRKRSGSRVLGMDAVRRVDYMSSAVSREEFFGSEPVVSGEEVSLRQALKRSLDEFVSQYRSALREYREKGVALFPEGTWWMRRCLGATCRTYCHSG